MTKAHERVAVFVFGVVFLTTLLVLAVWLPNPTSWQYQLFRVLLALAAAGVAAMIPGSMEVSLSNWLKAGGALAVFALVMYKSPAQLVIPPAELMGPLELHVNRQGKDFSSLPPPCWHSRGMRHDVFYELKLQSNDLRETPRGVWWW